jgi:hypothetical protein
MEKADLFVVRRPTKRPFLQPAGAALARLMEVS